MPKGVITRITRQRSGPARIEVDGLERARLPVAVVRVLGMTEGGECDPDRIILDASEIARACAFERGLRLTATRERSRAEVERALVRDGYEAGAVSAAATRLVEIGAVDDERFAGALARTLCAARGFGPARALHALAAAGIDDATAAAAVAAACPPDSEVERATSQARSLAQRCAGQPARLAERLIRRGYSTSTAWKAARIALAGLGGGIDAAACDPRLDVDGASTS